MMKTERYTIISTADGSSTLFSSDFNEAMHTDAGAYEESLVKHIIPSGILEKKRDTVSVLDVGFGIGYNLCALICESSKLEQPPFIKAVSLEMDDSMGDMLNEIVFNDERDSAYFCIKEAFKNGRFNNDHTDIRVLFGDARQSAKKLADEKVLFDAVFQDAFSPGKNPELWTLDWFRIINTIMNDDAVLTTYSSAPQIRRALIEAGLRISKGPSTGIKRESTLASRTAELDYYSEAYIDELLQNAKSMVYRDETLLSARETILERRITEMKKLREDRRACQCHQAPRE